MTANIMIYRYSESDLGTQIFLTKAVARLLKNRLGPSHINLSTKVKAMKVSRNNSTDIYGYSGACTKRPFNFLLRSDFELHFILNFLLMTASCFAMKLSINFSLK